MTDRATGRAFLDASTSQLEKSAETIEHCLNQLTETQLWWRPAPSLNSIGILIRHLCGNLRQWVIAGAGGTADTRNRPAEFADPEQPSKQELLTHLKDCVDEAVSVLNGLNSDDLLSQRRVQGFDTNVLSAIYDSTAHFQGHTQEIISLTRQQLGEEYQFSFVPATPEEGAEPAD